MAAVQTFPDDENGDTLRFLQAHGVDLTKERTMDFSVVFPSPERALAFLADLDAPNCDLRVTDEDVTISIRMIPDHAAISRFENEIAAVAARYEGFNDGWGFLIEAPG